MRTTLPLLAGLTLAACVTDGGGGSTAERRQIFTCDRGPEIVVVFAGDTARIESETGPPIVMQRRPSASGFWYESGTHSIRGAGEEITYTIGRMAPMICTPLRPTPR